MRFRPCSLPTSAMRSSRPSGSRTLHHKSPLVVVSVTSSSSPNAVANKGASAFAREGILGGEMPRSSTRMTNARLPGWSGRRFVANGKGRTGSPRSAAWSRSKASKLTIAWGLPSSVKLKSSRVSARTGRRSTSCTTTSKVISSTLDEKTGGLAFSWPNPAGGRRAANAQTSKLVTRGVLVIEATAPSDTSPRAPPAASTCPFIAASTSAFVARPRSGNTTSSA